MKDNKKEKNFKEVTQRFCPNLGDNAIIVRMVESGKECFSCLSSADCQNCGSCEHQKNKERR